MEGSFGGYKKGYKNPKSKQTHYDGGGVSYNKEESLEFIENFPCLAIPERGISKETAEHFGIRTRLSAKDGLTQEAHYFPYTLDGKVVGYKKRDLTIPKQQKMHFSTVGFQSVACDLFGQTSGNKTGGKKLWITEGEYDCAVLWQTIKERYPKANPTVLSISNGTANAVQNLGQKSNQKFIGKFDEIILAFDADKATEEEKAKKIMKGKDAVAAVYSLMPKIKVADLPDDFDPCDMIKQGMSEQLYWAAMKPVEYIPEGFRTYDQFREKAHEIPKLGKEWPWPTMTKLTLGRRKGEGYFLGSGKHF